jgi:hypothetical protein
MPTNRKQRRKADAQTRAYEARWRKDAEDRRKADAQRQALYERPPKDADEQENLKPVVARHEAGHAV